MCCEWELLSSLKAVGAQCPQGTDQAGTWTPKTTTRAHPGRAMQTGRQAGSLRAQGCQAYIPEGSPNSGPPN